MKSTSIVTSSVVALLVGILVTVPVAAQDRAKPKTASSSDSAGSGITKDQADGILDELRQIRQLLEKQQAQLDRVVTPQPSVSGAPEKVQMSVKSTWRSLGRADAPITLVEFADYECPFCKAFHTATFSELKKNYIDAGKVRFVSRDLPLEFHPTASRAAEAARCAGDQDKYWELRDALLTNPSAPNDDVIKKAAVSLSIEMKGFQACLDSNKYKSEVQEDAAEATTLHLMGTPSFVLGRMSGDKLDGVVLVGAQPYASFDSAIQKMLKDAVNQTALSPQATHDAARPQALDNPQPAITSSPEGSGSEEDPSKQNKPAKGTTLTSSYGSSVAQTTSDDQTPEPNNRAATFIENKGQWDEHVRFQLRSGAKTLWLTNGGVMFDNLRAKTNGRPDSNPELKSTIPDRTSHVPDEYERLVFSEDFTNANSAPGIEAIAVQPGKYNYLVGSDPAKWHTGVGSYAAVVYRNVWDGIDVRLAGKGANIEQEFIVHPGADLSRVQIAYRGIDKLETASDGSLLVHTAYGDLTESAPRIYQQKAGHRVAVKGQFKLTSPTSYSFAIGKHDVRQPLVIDPTVLYSTYLGGSAGNNVGFFNQNQEVATGIAVDTAGNAYVTGYTVSPDFPTTPGAFQTSAILAGLISPSISSFVTKLNPTGSALIYSTYLNTTAGQSFSASNAIAVDQNGNAYVTGYTSSNIANEFPTTPNAYWPTNSNQQCASTDFFVTELNPTGNQLVYSSCFNISANAGNGVVYGYYLRSIAVDPSGRIVVGGGAGDGFPTTPNAYQSSFPGGGEPAAILAVFDTTMSGTASLVYSTYFGLPTNTSPYGVSGYAIAVDSFENIYLTGYAGAGMPVTPGAFQPSVSGAGLCNPYSGLQVTCPDAFVAKFNSSVSGTQSLIYSTYLGGPGGTTLGTHGNGIAVDSAGSAYVTGQTGSAMFPVTPGAFQTTTSPTPLAGNLYGAFLSKLSPSGSSLIYSTYIAGNSGSSGNGIAVDSLGNAYVAGNFRAGGPPNPFFPITPDAFESSFAKLPGEGQEAFLTKLNPDGSALIYSSYLGGNAEDVATSVAIDQAGDAYLAGWTSSLNFPVSPNAFQPSVHGTGDAFVTKFPFGMSQNLTISALTPSSGGNAGTVSPQIFGTGFHAGATAQLSCGSTILGTNLTVGPGGRFLNTTFDLTTAQPGTCDVVVTNPDGTSSILTQAFTVLQGGAPNIQIYLTGVAVRQAPPEVLLSPSKTAFFATASNIGNADAHGALVAATLGAGFSLSGVQPPGLDSVTNMTTAGVASWSISNLAPGQSMVFTYLGNTAAAAFGPPVPIGPVWGLPGLPPPAFLTPLPPVPILHPGPSLQDMLSCVEDNVQIGSNNGGNCLNAALKCGEAAALCSEPDYATNGCDSALAECLADAISCALTEKCVPTGSISTGSTGSAGCVEISTAPAGGGGTTTCAEIITPADPNSLVGPSGVGGQRWIRGTQPLTYGISFGNEATATAPAQQVIVTQPLGMNIDLSTLSLPIITVPNGTNVVQVPIPANSFNPRAGVNEVITNIDLRPTQSLLVNVDAKLNPATQTLTWTFTSIDPTTGSPPLNPLVGFLPPGAVAFLSFSAMPTAGLATGAQIAEQATVVFDGQASMSTQVWLNTIDNTPPTSHVTALPSNETSASFTVAWSGTDVGSGIQDYTIYVSDNGAAYTALQTNTTATSATFTGQLNHTYNFYSIARDLVGNVEGTKTAAEATTQVVQGVTDNIPPITTALASPPPNAAGWNNSNVTVNLNSADNPGGSGVNHITYSIAGAQTVASTAITGISASFTISTEGSSTITFFATDNAGNVEAAHALTIRLDKTPPAFTTFPASLTVPPASPAGAVVTYALPTAGDATSGISSAGISCTPAPGSTFPLGTTTVTCTVADNAGNVTRGSFSVTVTMGYNFKWTIGKPAPALNSADVSDGYRVAFSLGGNFGLNVVTSITSTSIPCTGPRGVELPEAESRPGLSYNATTGNYQVAFAKAGATAGGTCAQFTLILNDGTTETIDIKYVR